MTGFSIENKKPLYMQLWIWVVVFMVSGIIFAIIEPQYTKSMKIIIDYFIKLIKLIVGPIIFLTVLSGIVGMNNLKQLSSIGLKSFIYFEVISSLALLIGLSFGYLFNPGGGLNLTIRMVDPILVTKYSSHSTKANTFLNIFPKNPIEPFLTGNTLQILFMAIVLGFIIYYTLRTWQKQLINSLHKLQQFFFAILSYIMWLAPVAAFASMAFMIGQFGATVILHMLLLITTMMLSCIFFIVVILGIIAKVAGFNIFKFLYYIKDEIILVFATSSSESALGPIIKKLKYLGAADSVVGIVVPSGYSFNLDGTNIYLALVIAFLCQAFNITLSWQEHLTIILILMIASKGAAGVTGSGFIVLAGTLSAINTHIPVAAISLVVGIDKIMSELRSTTNLIGNSVATVVIAQMENKLDKIKLTQTITNSP